MQCKWATGAMRRGYLQNSSTHCAVSGPSALLATAQHGHRAMYACTCRSGRRTPTMRSEELTCLYRGRVDENPREDAVRSDSRRCGQPWCARKQGRCAGGNCPGMRGGCRSVRGALRQQVNTHLHFTASAAPMTLCAIALASATFYTPACSHCPYPAPQSTALRCT